MKSELGNGSEFWFDAEFEKQTDISELEKLQMGDIAGINVLVVDDHPVNRLLVTNFLKSWGCRYDEAECGSVAIEMMHAAAKSQMPYKVALLDMLMPEMDGRELCSRIKNDPEIADTRLILLTSLGQRGDAAWIHEAGFAGYLTKPLRQSQLRDCLAMVVGSSAITGQILPKTLVTRHRVSEAQKRNARILLVEDNPTNQEVASTILRRLGYRVEIAGNGKEAIIRLKNELFTLVFMDCQMPELDGFAATALIRDPASVVLNPDIPIIAMTANAMQGDRDRCIQSGMDDYIAKPVQPDDFVAVISRWLNGNKGLPPVEHIEVSKKQEPELFAENELLQRLLGEEALVKRIIGTFSKDTPEQLREMKQAIAENARDKAIMLAHNIKGAAANISSPALRSAAQSIEDCLKKDDQQNLPLALKEFDRLYLELSQILQKKLVS